MPDGSRSTLNNAAYTRGHRRLVEYGQVLLQQAKGDEPNARDDRPPLPKRIWTAKEEASAWEVHRLVIALPARERIVVQVFYKAREAEAWDDIEPDKQRQIEDEMCREINARMRRFSAQIQELPRTLRGHQVSSIRNSAIAAIGPALDSQYTSMFNAPNPCLGEVAP